MALWPSGPMAAHGRRRPSLSFLPRTEPVLEACDNLVDPAFLHQQCTIMEGNCEIRPYNVLQQRSLVAGRWSLTSAMQIAW